MADQHDAHEHGTMDISNQEKMFGSFLVFGTRLGIFCVAVLVFLAIFRT